MERMIRFWDWDGVVGKTDPFNEYAFGKVLDELGLPKRKGWYQAHFPGRKLEDSILHYLEVEGLPTNLLPLIAEGKKGFDGEYEAEIEPYEDALELIRRFRVEGHLQAVVTGARLPQIEAGMRKFGITDSFEVVVTNGDYGQGKPSPDPYIVAYWKACQILGGQNKRSNCIGIEDAPSGISAVKAAGMFCIAVAHTHAQKELREAGADLVVDDLREVNLAIRNRGLV